LKVFYRKEQHFNFKKLNAQHLPFFRYPAVFVRNSLFKIKDPPSSFLNLTLLIKTMQYICNGRVQILATTKKKILTNVHSLITFINNFL